MIKGQSMQRPQKVKSPQIRSDLGMCKDERRLKGREGETAEGL